VVVVVTDVDAITKERKSDQTLEKIASKFSQNLQNQKIETKITISPVFCTFLLSFCVGSVVNEFCLRFSAMKII